MGCIFVGVLKFGVILVASFNKPEIGICNIIDSQEVGAIDGVS